MAIRDRPLLTKVYGEFHLFKPESGTAYVWGPSVEERSTRCQGLEKNASDVLFFRIVEQNRSDFKVESKTSSSLVTLRSRRSLNNFWSGIQRKSIYLDITGLAHHVWAPLLRAGLSMDLRLKVLYAEPRDYRFSTTPTEGEIFDLSEKISGIAPIPGFSSLTDSVEKDVCFVPLLGFEGTRLAYLVEQVQPPGRKIFPIIGVPGFRPEYPFYAYHGNRSILTETLAWQNARFAIANCPFSLFYELEDIAEEFPSDLLKIAPIGTKPHALGAVLYAIMRPPRIELVYDHPIRRAKATEGTGRLLEYHVSAFAGS